MRAMIGVTALFGALALLAAPALAAPAPITYAAQTAALSLDGGGERSYGYGAQGPAPASAPPLDLRRTSASAGQGTQVQQEQERVGPPYQVNGRWYVPAAEPNYNETGTASWYGPDFHGRAAANGETYDQEALTAAHPTLPLNSLVQVTNLQNGREAILRITDRGPFVDDRLIDVSHAAAAVLGFDRQGRARVNVRYLGPAPRRVAVDGRGLDAAPAAAPTPVSAEAEGPTSLLPPPAEPRQPAPAVVTPIDFAPPAPMPLDRFFVQIGAFADQANADRVAAAVRSAGAVSMDMRGALHRVRLGPFADRAEAAAAQRALADLGYADTLIATR